MRVDEVFEIKNNEFLRQFEAEIEGELITLEYSEQPRQIFLTKLSVNEEMKLRGDDQVFLRSLFDKFTEENQTRIMPTCPEVREFFKAHKREYRGLLPTGINL
ncbi:MAG TPA: N-acetyltransferase [Flavobacteriaceae bacterium]|nr:N-acetyltransferase [Flavobacteriaceae bacterium]